MMKHLRFLLSVLVGSLTFFAIPAQAASVGTGGYTNSFGTLPSAADWATYSIAGASGDSTSAAQLDTAVRAVAASTVNGTLLSDASATPAANASAAWSSASQFLQTRPTGNHATLLMATFQNNSGTAASSVTISYDFTKTDPTTDEISGHLVYYSLTGAANSWVAIPEFTVATAGRLTAELSITWPIGGTLYLLWADDNGSGSPDTAQQIDNFSLTLTSATPVPASITQSPTNVTVTELGSAVFRVTAAGNPAPSYSWYKNQLLIPNATNATLILDPVALSDNGAQIFAVASNTASSTAYTATSGVALLTVRADTNPPALLAAFPVGLTQVQVLFSERIALAGATNPANYAITSSVGSLTISAAALDGSRSNVTLTVSPMAENVQYTLRINGLTDQAQAANPLPPNTSLTFVAVSFTSTGVGSPGQPGSVTTVNGGYNVAGGGNDIGGTSDQFQFVYQQKNGDFDVQIRVAGLNASDVWAKAGLMARETLSAGSPFAAALATPGTVGSVFLSRTTAGGAAALGGSQPVNFPYTWLRLKRAGNVFSGYCSYDGQRWRPLGSATIAMAATVYFGMATTAHNNSQLAHAQFRDLTTVSSATLASAPPSREPLGPSSRKIGIVISEIMYKPALRADTNDLEFVELYNTNPFFEDLSGWRLSGDIDFTFPAGTKLQGGQFLVIAASPESVRSVYGITNVTGPYTNRLGTAGTVRLRSEIDAVLLEVKYQSDPPWPAGADGTGHSLVLARPSYGEGFPEAWDLSADVGGSPGGMDGFRESARHQVVINEFLAHTDPPQTDYVELYNAGRQPVDISGCFLSDNPTTNKFVIPAGTVLPAGGFVAYTEATLGFALSAAGETIYFRNAGDNQVLDCVRFKGQAAGVASGRVPDGAREIYPLAAPTPGTNNSAIRIHDLVINEIMYNPISDSSDDEYVEIYNQGTNTWDLTGWRLRGGIGFDFPSNTVIAPQGYLVVAKNATNLLAKYPTNLTPSQVLGDYSGTLGNGSDRVALAMPDTFLVVTTNLLGETVTNTELFHVDVDEVTYRDGGRWGKWANGGGSSLELIDPRSNHRLPSNWADSDETAKAPWTTITATGALDLGAQTASHFEVLALEEGEFLLDNAVAMPVGGANLIPAGDASFESSSAWLMRGNHARSTIDTSGGDGGGRCLHVRASGRGDSLANRALVPLISAPSSGNFTLSARVRWLRGWPEALIRLHGNYLEATGRMAIPTNLGTPGARNSRTTNNAPPAIYEVATYPILPAAGEAVLITARVHDPDGVASLSLRWRTDPGSAYTSVLMLDNGTGGDALAKDGIYTTTLPGQASGALVAFQLAATDAQGASSVFPEGSAVNVREGLIRFGEVQPVSSFGTYRMYFTQSAVNSWINRPVLSNEPVEGTLVYGNFRVIYHIGARYAGSPYHQGFNSPVGNACHYSVDLPPDDRMLGTANFNKIHGPGNGSFDDPTLQREQTAYWVARKMGLPWMYRRYVAVYVNGNRRGTFMEDMQTPGSDVVEEFWPDDSSGQLYKLQPWFEQPDVATGASSPVNNQSWCTLNAFYSGGQHKLARYRHNYLVRAAQGTANNFTNVFALVEAASQFGNGFITAMEALVDTDQWLKTFAVEHAVGNWDSFGNQNAQNMYGYKPTQGKWGLLIFDLNIVLNNPNAGGTQSDIPTSTANLFKYNTADGNMGKFYNIPYYRRAYWRHLKAICNGPYSDPDLNALVDAKYAAFLQNGQTVQDMTAVKTFISTSRSGILSLLAAEDAPAFTVQGGTPTLTSNLVVLSGSAPVEVVSLKFNGVTYPVTWTSAKDWTAQIVLGAGTNTLTVQGLDQTGKPLPGMEATKTVVFQGAAQPPQGIVAFTEIMFNPTVPNAEYVELFNHSTNYTYDLRGWRINGLGYEFPLGTLLLPRTRLVLAKDRAAFATAYGSGVSVFDTFPGILQTNGETLTLFRPAPAGSPEPEEVVDRVRYETNAPWPAGTNGQGAALQLVDANQDHSRVVNWSDGAGWKFVTFSATNLITNAVNVQIRVKSAGDIYLDDVRVETGTVVGAGTNLIVNGDFEGPLGNGWLLGTNVLASTLSTNIKYSGNSALHLIASARGNTVTSGLSQLPLPLVKGQVYTVSFWFLPSATLTNIDMYCGFSVYSNNIPTLQSAYARSPGAPNSVATTLPDLPPLWLNEVQSQNVSGPADNFGERDPWVELYNSGANAVSLEGWYLADNYTNLAQWPFPAGTVIHPGQFLVVWLDGQPEQTAAGNLHARFRLGAGPGSVALVTPLLGGTNVFDYLNYPGLAPGASYGNYPDGQVFYRQIFAQATPGATNDPALGLPVIKINEWMSDNTTLTNRYGTLDDWFELYNPGSEPVDLTGLYLTDNPSNKFQYQIPAGYTVPARGYLLVWADGLPARNSTNDPDLHVNFQLSRRGEAIGLYAADGTPLDEISFTEMGAGDSIGRYPDGSALIVLMSQPTPNARNAANIVVQNNPPAFGTLPELRVLVGQTLSFDLTATDPDLPAQALTFALRPGAPPGAVLTTNGHFAWVPGAGQLGTNVVPVEVTDDGTPPLSTPGQFQVIVGSLPNIGGGTVGVANGKISFGFAALPGVGYQVQYKDRLSDPQWTNLGTNQTATGSTLTVTDDLQARPQRYYRVISGN